MLDMVNWTVPLEDRGTPVTEDYKDNDNKFTGKIRKVTIELK